MLESFLSCSNWLVVFRSSFRNVLFIDASEMPWSSLPCICVINDSCVELQQDENSTRVAMWLNSGPLCLGIYIYI